jgi:hypothetical protein
MRSTSLDPGSSGLVVDIALGVDDVRGTVFADVEAASDARGDKGCGWIADRSIHFDTVDGDAFKRCFRLFDVYILTVCTSNVTFKCVPLTLVRISSTILRQ